jgi:hypothetical protein
MEKIYKYKHGTCNFIYKESYDTVENAAKEQGGTFVEVKVDTVRIHFNKVKKENLDGTQESSAKAEGPTAKETRKVSGAKV